MANPASARPSSPRCVSVLIICMKPSLMSAIAPNAIRAPRSSEAIPVVTSTTRTPIEANSLNVSRQKSPRSRDNRLRSSTRTERNAPLRASAINRWRLARSVWVPEIAASPYSAKIL